MEFGYLREDSIEANRAGIDKDTNICRTGLEEYLKVIFPEIDDWVHDRPIGGEIKELKRKRPDYRSDQLRMIIEFDSLPHYQNPDQIQLDKERTELYQKYGYKVVRIPYFIQLTQETVKILFNRNISIKLFPDTVPSLTIHSKATPAFLCPLGIIRMAKEFKNFPNQYTINMDYLKHQPTEFFDINGYQFLEEAYRKN